MASTSISFDILARDRASAAFNRIGNSADRSNHSLEKLGVVLKRTGLAVGILGAAAIAFGVKAGASYVNSLNQIQALTGATDKQMTAAAKSLEANSSAYAKMGQSTGDAAAGVVELTKAGLSLHDALGAIYGTMTLAKAGELSVADASTITANALNTFHLKAKQAGDVANYLANAANISSADVSDIAESFKYVAPVAASAGVSIQQVNAILAELANSGLKASQAGTSLRTFLLNLEAPAKAGQTVLSDLNVQLYDAHGNLKPLPQIIGLLSNSLKGLTQAQRNVDLKTLFGKTGIAGATTILNGGTKGLAEYTKGVERAGAAEALAESRSKGLAGSFAIFKASATSAAQAIYRQFSPLVDQAIRPVAIWFSNISTKAAPALQREINKLTGDFQQVYPKVKGLADEIANDLKPALHQALKSLRDNNGQLNEFAQQVTKATPPVAKLTAAATKFSAQIGGGMLPKIFKLNDAINKIPFPMTLRGFSDMTYALGVVSNALTKAGNSAGQFGTAVQNKINQALIYVRSIPSKIQAAVGNLGSILYGAGQAAVQGLVNGIESKVSAVTSALHHITSLIPLHKGPIDKDRELLRPAGRAIMDGLMQGLADRRLPLQKALDDVTGLIQKTNDRLSNLKSTKAGFRSTFTADSLFGTDLSHTTTDDAGNTVTTPETIKDLIKFQKQQQSQAHHLLKDVKQVEKMGLSKSLVNQLRSQGTSGAAALHALAMGGPGQIRLLNSLNKQTNSELEAAGMKAGNYARGGSINADIRRAQKQDRILERLEHALHELADSQKKDQTIVVKIGEQAIITAINRYNHTKGKSK